MFKIKKKNKELKRIIEAILLVAYEPVKIKSLEKVLGTNQNIIEEIIKKLQSEYRKENRGFQIKKVANGYRFYTHPDSRDHIEKIFSSTMRGYFSQAALEVLAIIAYNQPISRIGVNEIRGVRSESVISTLLNRRLIKKISKEFGPGRPILYKTTPFFLESFGLNSLEDLPEIEKFSETTKKGFNKDKENNYLNVIAIDGPAGSGKSTVSKEIARKLNFFYLYTGAMYRALAWLAINRKINLNDEQHLTNLLINSNIEIANDENFNNIIRIDNKDVTDKIFTNEVSKVSSKIAVYKGVRKFLTKKQRKICKRGEIIVEGRDATTVICPDAIVKIYLDATFEERARRRKSQLIEMKQKPPEFNELINQIKERDKRDKNRKIAPLIKTEDSIYIDSTYLTISQVVEKIINIYRERFKN